MKFPCYCLTIPRRGKPHLLRWASEDALTKARGNTPRNMQLNGLRRAGTTTYFISSADDLTHVLTILREWLAEATAADQKRIDAALESLHLVAFD